MTTRRLMPAAFALALMSATMAVPACAHASPSSFATCMQDSGKGAALINAVNDVLDGDNRIQVLEQLAIAIGPDVLKCALEQVAAKKATGVDSVGGERARRAREYLDGHGGSALLMPRPSGGPVLAGICPFQCTAGPSDVFRSADRGADAPGDESPALHWLLRQEPSLPRADGPPLYSI